MPYSVCVAVIVIHFLTIINVVAFYDIDIVLYFIIPAADVAVAVVFAAV